MSNFTKFTNALKLVLFALVGMYLSGCSTPFTVHPVPAYANANIISKLPDGEVAQLRTRDDVTVDVLHLAAPEPKANVVLFPEGDGVIEIDSSGDIVNKKKRAFSIRNRKHFLQHNINVFVVDAPSDHHNQNAGMLWGFRAEPEHLKDISYVFAYVRDKASGLPTYVVGSDRGTESAIYSAINFQHVLKGVVLASPTTENTEFGDPVENYDLENLKLPILIVGHEDDECAYSDPDDIEDILEKAEHAQPRMKVLVTGGQDTKKGFGKRSARCKGKTYHQFYRADVKALDAISGFMKN